MTPEIPLNSQNKSALIRNAAVVFAHRLTREAGGLRRMFRLRSVFWHGVMARFLPEWTLGSLRAAAYRKAGCRIGPHVTILGRLGLIGGGDAAGRLTIGEGSVIAPSVVFGLDGEIHIGKNVSLSPYVTLYTATHAIGFGSRRMTLAPVARSVTVGDGAWVGMRCLILPGVTLGEGCVVAAGSVVTQDVPPHTLASGNPATVQQKLPFANR